MDRGGVKPVRGVDAGAGAGPGVLELGDGMVLTQSCGLTTVAVFLTTLLGTRYDAQRQHLRDWCF